MHIGVQLKVCASCAPLAPSCSLLLGDLTHTL